MTNIKTIVTNFENLSLPKNQWTHSAHIAVAFFHLKKQENFDNTLIYLREQIRKYNISVGTENTEISGYHETLTVFWLKVIAEFLVESNETEIETAYNLFLRTIMASPKFPIMFYSKDLLFSKKTRQIWTEPNLLPISKIKEFIHKNMEQHYILTDNEFEDQFADCSLGPHLFSHEAHIRLAWIHIKKYGEPKAIQNIRKQLQKYVQHLGVSEKFNDTLTVASIKAVNHFMKKKDFQSFYEFIINNKKLKINFKDIINQHYSFDIFHSLEAKMKYLEPDLLEFTNNK